MTKMRKPDAKPENEQPESNESDDMLNEAVEACARDLIRAVHAQDVKGAAQAMRDAFTIMEAAPHTEADHSDSSFKSQNVKAAQDVE